MLRKAKPDTKGGLPFLNSGEEFWPQDNEAEEAELRTELTNLESMPLASARQSILALDKRHGCRASGYGRN